MHGLLLLLSLSIPLFFFMLYSLDVNSQLYNMLFLHSLFIYWLVLLPLRNRYLDIDEIDFYAGGSSKLMFLAVALPGMRDAFHYHTFHNIEGIYFVYTYMGSAYAYTLPFEFYIARVPYLIYGFATVTWRIFVSFFPSLLIISNLAVLSLYLTLLHRKKGYRHVAAKIIFICGVIANANIITLFFISATIFIVFAPIHLPYLLLNLYRLHNIFGKELEARLNTNTEG